MLGCQASVSVLSSLDDSTQTGADVKGISLEAGTKAAGNGATGGWGWGWCARRQRAPSGCRWRDFRRAMSSGCGRDGGHPPNATVGAGRGDPSLFQRNLKPQILNRLRTSTAIRASVAPGCGDGPHLAPPALPFVKRRLDRLRECRLR